MDEQSGGSHLVSRRAVLGFLGAAGATVTFGSLVACSSTNNSNRSRADNGILTTAESAGVVVLAQARQALAEGSFGVGARFAKAVRIDGGHFSRPMRTVRRLTPRRRIQRRRRCIRRSVGN